MSHKKADFDLNKVRDLYVVERLSQGAVAKRLGVNINTLSRWIDRSAPHLRFERQAGSVTAIARAKSTERREQLQRRMDFARLRPQHPPIRSVPKILDTQVPIDEQSVRVLYVDHQLPATQVAALLCLDADQLHTWLRRSGSHLKVEKMLAAPMPARTTLSRAERNWVIRRLGQQVSAAEIASQLNYAPEVVANIEDWARTRGLLK